MSVQYVAFGEMAVTVDGTRHPLTRRRERGVLSVLLAAHGAPVAAERLVAEVWGDEAPGQTLAALQVAVSRLRTLVEPDRAARTGTRLVSTAAGYSLVAAAEDVDTWAFEARAETALAAESPVQRLAASDEARALWTAPPYADNDAPSVRHDATRLDELLLTLHELRARALLDLARPEEAHRTLAELVHDHPYRERMWSLLALAQYQSSRQADALETLRTLRLRLAEDLGVDPVVETRQLEEAVLRQDPALDTVSPAPPERPRTSAGTSRGRSVGRDAELERLLDLHRAALAETRTTFVLVAGEAGIGKSQLVEDLVATAGDSGTRVLVGRCLEGEYAPALWPWLAVVRDLAEDHPVSPLLEPLLAGGAADEASGSGTTLRMYDAVVDLLVAASRRRPLMVLLEDLHWADASSLLLLRHLAGSATPAGLTVVGTRRTTGEPTSDALVDTMASLARVGAERIRLDGLDHDSVRALLDRSVGAHSARLDDVVTEVSGGNPFFVLQYARLLAATPDLSQVDPDELPVPDGVRDVLRQRVARLPDEASRLLASASVLGLRVDPDLLAELTSVPVDTCLDLLDLAMASGLLAEQQATYGFVHALARESLYAELSTARKMRLHDRAGRVLEPHWPGDADAAAAVAHHAHVAAPLGTEHAERACEWLARAAAVAVSRNAYPEALDLWQRILSDTTHDSLTAASAHRGTAAALIRLGRMTEAHAALDAAVSIASAHEQWSMVAETTKVLSGAGPWSWREHGVVHAPFVDVLTAALPHVGPDLQARLLAILQLEHFYGWQTRKVEDYGARSVSMARATGDHDLLRDVLMLRLVATTGSWQTQERLGLVEELLQLQPVGEAENETVVTLLFYLGQVQWDRGEPAAADEAMTRCATAAIEVRHTGLDIPLDWWRAARARDRDDPSHEAILDEALEKHRRVGYVFSRELECMQAVRRKPVGAPVEDAIVESASQGGMPLRALVALALLESGQPDRAHALLGDHVSDEIVDYCSTAGRAMRLLVLTETGTEEEIREALVPLEGHLGVPVSYGTIDHLGVVDHFVAAAYAALGDPRAHEVSLSAVELNARLGCAPWLRRSEELLARVSRP